MLTRMEGLAPARLIHVLARGRASAAWSHLYARHSPKLESWNASTRRNGPNTLLGSTAQHSNRQRDRRDQDSPDPERRPPDQIFRQIVVEPRVRNVRCREERPQCRGLSGATGTETMSMSPREDDTGFGSC